MSIEDEFKAIKGKRIIRENWTKDVLLRSKVLYFIPHKLEGTVLHGKTYYTNGTVKHDHWDYKYVARPSIKWVLYDVVKAQEEVLEVLDKE